jgi:hypothetical protein
MPVFRSNGLSIHALLLSTDHALATLLSTHYTHALSSLYLAIVPTTRHVSSLQTTSDKRRPTRDRPLGGWASTSSQTVPPSHLGEKLPPISSQAPSEPIHKPGFIHI